jgi:2-methylisocitrate lyase-like PEP mutase family enzyme
LMNSAINRQLRERVHGRDAFIVPGAPNALTARIIEDIGFEAVYVTGAGVTNTYLGAPDVGLITLTELADHVSAIRDAVTSPLIVDADTGFGNPLNVTRTIRVLEKSGANAIQLEDQISPKRCGHFDGKQVTSREEMIQKIHAAVDARWDDDLMIVARTDARMPIGFEEAIERAASYIEAGADMTFVEAPQSIEEIESIPRLLDSPQIINLVEGGKTPLLNRKKLENMGFSIVLYANAALQGSIWGMQNILGHLREQGSILGMLDRIAEWDERQRLVGKRLFDELEKKYEARRCDR